MSTELVNKVAELGAEVGKAQLIIESKDEYIKGMREHIEKQEADLKDLHELLNEKQGQLNQFARRSMEGAMMDSPDPSA